MNPFSEYGVDQQETNQINSKLHEVKKESETKQKELHQIKKADNIVLVAAKKQNKFRRKQH